MAATSSTAVRRSCGSSMAPAARPPSSTSSPRTNDHTVEGIAEHAAPASPAARASLGTPAERLRLTRASWQARGPCRRSQRRRRGRRTARAASRRSPRPAPASSRFSPPSILRVRHRDTTAITNTRLGAPEGQRAGPSTIAPASRHARVAPLARPLGRCGGGRCPWAVFASVGPEDRRRRPEALEGAVDAEEEFPQELRDGRDALQ